MPEDTADLERALTFVTSRIEKEAEQAGEPLDEDERSYLHDLPTKSVFGYERSVNQPFVPRDFAFEKFVRSAKNAYRSEIALHPAAASSWQFAAAVFRLNGHPMLWLLQWAKIPEARKPLSDRAQLWLAGLFMAVAGVGFFVLAEYFDLGRAGTYLAIGGWVGMAVALHFVSKKTERALARQAIERTRPPLT